MRVALVIAGRILRQRLRDRSAIVFAVLTPLGLALAFAAIIPDFTGTFHTTIAIVDADHGHLAESLVSDGFGGLTTAGIADIEHLDSEAAARTAVDGGDVGAAVIIPAGFTSAIQSGAATEVRILGGAGATGREVARAVVTKFANAIGAIQLAVRTVGANGGTADAATIQAAAAAVQGSNPIGVVDSTAAHVQASLATFYGAAMAIMFVFFATQYGALALLGERRIGTFNRLLAAPIRPSSIVLGGAIAGLALGLVAMTVMVVATTLIVHASWGPPLLVAALVVAAAIAATGISAFLATLARSVEQAGSLNAIVALCLSAIGGVFIPLSQAPEILARISQVTPHAWFLRAIDSLSAPGVGFGDILPSVTVLVAMGGVAGAIGLLRAHRSLVVR